MNSNSGVHAQLSGNQSHENEDSKTLDNEALNLVKKLAESFTVNEILNHGMLFHFYWFSDIS
jgi:hypothetical protein